MKKGAASLALGRISTSACSRDVPGAPIVDSEFRSVQHRLIQAICPEVNVTVRVRESNGIADVETGSKQGPTGARFATDSPLGSK